MENRDLEHLRHRRFGERTLWIKESAWAAARTPPYVPETSPRLDAAFLADLLEDFKQAKHPEEYAAGFRARLAEIPAADSAHPSWRAGWEDADTELLEEARHRRCLAEGREDSFLGTRRLLYDAGYAARENGVFFAECRTEPWKAGWIAADILIGTTPAL